MPVYLLQGDGKSGPQSAIFDRLRPIFPDLVAKAPLDAILKAAASGERGDPAIVLVVVPSGDRDYFERLVELARQYSRGLFFILIGDEISASDYKRLVRSGGADWASINADPSEVAEIVARVKLQADSTSTAARPAGSRPVTISFVPSAGGVGNATLVIETAASVRSNKANQHRKICIVDLDFQSSHVCDYLDSESRLHIAEFSSAPERLDEHLFESFRTRHSSGIDIFAAPRSKFYSETLNIHALDALFSMIAKRYDLVFVDYPLTWFSWTAPIIAASDVAVITGVNTIPCLRQISETLAFVRSSGSAALQIGIVINRCEHTLLGSIVRRKDAEMVLRDERIFFIANRPEAIESVNIGVPMVLAASSGKLRRDFAPLAEFCSEPKTSHFLGT
jgi:pilus assembly protein CpaE